MIKGWGEFNKVKPDQVTPMSKDMFGFVFGYALIMGGGPYAQELSGAEGWHKNLRIDGWIRLWLSGNRGCMPSLHMIADFFDGQFSQEIYYAFSRAYTSHDTERKQIYPQLMTLLEMSAAKGDQEALRLINGLAK